MCAALALLALLEAGCGDAERQETFQPAEQEAAVSTEPGELSSTTVPVATSPGQADGTDTSPSKEAPDPAVAAALDGIGRGLAAEVGVAAGWPGGEGSVVRSGPLRRGAAWSTIKVAIALAALERAGGPDGLSEAEAADIEAAITASDNSAADRLFRSLADSDGGASGAADAVTGLLREAGDRKTVVSAVGRDGFSPYGQTEWSLKAQLRLVSALLAGCVADKKSRELVLGAMSDVSSDVWGLGSSGTAALWKGGWGPGADGAYLVRQMGAVKVAGEWVPVAIAVRSADGAFATGTTLASEVARRLTASLRDVGSLGSTSC